MVVESLGERYEDLRGAGKTEIGLLVLLWKAKTDLFALVVDVWAKREPLMTAQAGNILGTQLKEKILAAIKRQKAPVEKAIKLFNAWQKAYFQKADPRQLQLPENWDLTFDKFLRIDLDNPLWSNGHFYYNRAPWATDPNVRIGIKSVLLLDRVEEDTKLLIQELDWSITWVCQHWDVTIRAISNLREASTQEPIDLNNRFACILLSFPMKGWLRLLQSELARHLANHEGLMLAWMPDVEQLWESTCSRHTKSNHPWFEVIQKIKDDLTSSGVSDIYNALERLDFAKDDPNPPNDDERAEDHNWITDEESTPGGDDEVAACAELE
ncbi:hypothetical protein PCANC_04322 [Puccinia coronata f. sp. avenae]|nr:hypothetical protein PCANC_04322 [Puccinia coronata f. sp. avenae]